MIHYALRCADGHPFDGWFRDSAAFDGQASAGLLECPACGSTAVTRAMMAPGISSGRTEPPRPPSAPRAATEAPPMPAELRALLQRMRAEVERKCDYVGADFAEEARRRARGESTTRGIYGEASDEEAKLLAEEGVPIGRIPWVPRADG